MLSPCHRDIMPAHALVIAVCDFHVYHTVWVPSIDEELTTTEQHRNARECFAFAVVREDVLLAFAKK